MKNSQELLIYAKNLSILLVEDYDDLRENIGDILKNFFGHVDCVKNGVEALTLYKEKINAAQSFHIVLTDIRMPIMDGVELTRQIYKINPLQKIIVISAHDESGYLLSLINLGIEQFIKKPINFEELLRVLLVSSKSIVQGNKSKLPDPQDLVKCGGACVYDRKNMSLHDNGKNVYLTKYEILFMNFLSTEVGKIYSNEEIVNYYKSINESVDASNIRKLVSKLRKKLPDYFLESIYSVGYRFTNIN